jgi:prepilin-type N-terminal cleavage/methylation domain-containing protein
MKMDQGQSKSLSHPITKGGFGGISNQKGYTLVEVLIALGILGFGLMAVATMQVTAIKTNSRASDLSQGVTLAQAKAEDLMNLPYSALVDLDDDGDGTNQDADNDGNDDDGGNFGLNDTVDGGGNVIADDSELNVNGRYSIYWNVAVNEPAANSSRMRVIVTWTERGKDKRIYLDFVKTNLS